MLTNLEETESDACLEGSLYELIVVEGKYMTNVEIYNEVLHLLKTTATTNKDSLNVKSPARSYLGCCCAIPIACAKNGCIKWAGKMMLFAWLLMCFTGIISYFIRLANGYT